MNLKKLTACVGLLTALVLGVPQSAFPTVSNTTTQTVTANGNGSNTNFTITFDFRSNAWITVTLYDTSTNPTTVTSIPQQAGSGGFSVSGGNPGTTVVMGTAPSATQHLVIQRSVPLTQPVVFNPASIFPYSGLSSQLDQVTLAMQNLNAGVGNGSTAGGGSGGGSTVLPSPGAPYDLIGWNSLGASTVNATVAYDSGQTTFQSGDMLQFNGSGWATYPFNSANLMTTLNLGNQPLGAGVGGSGVSNSGLLTWGSNALTLNTSGVTNVTLPQSGTLIAGTATNNNVGSTLVSRDSSGNFSANTITANITGNVNIPSLATNGLLYLDSSKNVVNGTFSGSTHQAVTLLGLPTNGSCAQFDSLGNIVATGTACGSGGAGSGGIPYGSDTGTANAYVVSPSTAVVSTAGASVAFVAVHANTGAATINVSSAGAVALVAPGNQALVAGDIQANQIVVAMYDGTRWQLMSPQGYATATNTVSQAVKRDASGNFSASTITAALSGNATTATTATNSVNASTVSVSNSASYFPALFASSSNGNQPYNLGSGLTFNPSTNNLTTTTVTAALAGNATTATTATNFSGNLAGDVSGPQGTTAIGANKVTNAQLAQGAASTVKGNSTVSLANDADITMATLTAMLNVFTSGKQGVVPPSSGGSTIYLNGQGNWTAPPGTGGSTKAHWSGYIGGITGGAGNGTSSYADPTTATGAPALTQQSNSNFSTVVLLNSSNLGVSVYFPTSGDYLIQARVGLGGPTGSVPGCRLVDGTGTIIDPGSMAGVVVAGQGNDAFPCPLYGVYTATAGQVVNLKVQIAEQGGAHTVNVISTGNLIGSTAQVMWAITQM